MIPTDVNDALEPGHSSGGQSPAPHHGHEGYVVYKFALGQVFSEHFGFPCQFSFHDLLHIHYHIIRRYVVSILQTESWNYGPKEVHGGREAVFTRERGSHKIYLPIYAFAFKSSFTDCNSVMYLSSSSAFRIGSSGLFPVRINLELRIFWTVGRAPWTGNEPSRKATTYTGQHKQRKEKRIDTHASNEVQTHDPSAWAGEGIPCIIPRNQLLRISALKYRRRHT
jgi:hypothetical protein